MKNPIPASEVALCYYIACMGQEGLAATLIKTYLLGVRQVKLALGFADPQLSAIPRLQ